jgi:hypothetical protein
MSVRKRAAAVACGDIARVAAWLGVICKTGTRQELVIYDHDVY